MKTQVETSQAVILLAEDDPAMRSLLCDELWDLNCRIVEACDGDEALRLLSKTRPDVIVTDLRMPAGGLDYVARLHAIAPDSPIILMTAFGDAVTKATALADRAVAYFDKPVRMADLKSAIRRFVER